MEIGKFITALATVALVLGGNHAPVQDIIYPDKVKTLFEQTDARETPGFTDVPLIAVPQCKKAGTLVVDIQQQGARAVIIPETEDGHPLGKWQPSGTEQQFLTAG